MVSEGKCGFCGRRWDCAIGDECALVRIVVDYIRRRRSVKFVSTEFCYMRDLSYFQQCPDRTVRSPEESNESDKAASTDDGDESPFPPLVYQYASTERFNTQYIRLGHS